MGILATLNPRNWFSTRPVAPTGITNAQNRQMIRARFDNQFTTEDNRQLWAMSDVMSVDAQANMGVRRTLRMRGRYCYHNNPYAMGPINRIASFIIGSGPKLHMSTNNPAVNAAVETSFNLWSRKVRMARKYRVSRAARAYNGEGFLVLRTNPKVRHPVKLDLFEIECDQVSSPLYGQIPSQYPDQWFDGVTLDPWGNPESYQILRQHPGAFGAFLTMGYEFDNWPAEYVIHDYDRLRPAQQRGIPEVTPALDLFEERRRYRRAVLAAAETAAEYAGFVKTDAPAEGADNSPDTGFGTAMDYVDIKRRQMGVLPAGWSVEQMKAEQPVQGYDAYDLSLLLEMSQVLDVPLFILTGDARLANMASAYVATQGFIKRVTTDREDYDDHSDKVLCEWLKEARRIPGLIPAECPEDPAHEWRWPRIATHADPGKMATAQNQRLKNGHSPSLEFADEGIDFGEQCQRAAADYGVTEEEFKASLFQSTFASRGTPPPGSLSPDTGDAPDSPGDDDATANAGGSEVNRPFGGSDLRAWNPDQPRDEHGRFAGGGAGMQAAKRTPIKGSPHDQAKNVHDEVMKVHARFAPAVKGFQTRIDNLDRKRNLIADEHDRIFFTQPPKGKAAKAEKARKLAETLEKINAVDRQRVGAVKAKATAERRMNEEAFKAVAHEQPAALHGRGDLMGETNIQNGRERVAEMLGKGHPFERAKVAVSDNAGGRASFSSTGGGDGFINASRTDTVGTVAHEWTHAIEYSDPAVHAGCIAFLNRRTAGEAAQKLSDITGNKAYADHEVAKPDKFFHPYVGKIYGHDASEVLTMGVQRIVEDPARFAKEDPDHFQHTVAMLRHGHGAK